MKPQSEAEALTMLRNRRLALLQREEAIHYLAEHLNPQVIEELADTLTDPEFSIRWAAARALTWAGEAALVPVLRRLLEHGSSVTFRDVAYYVLDDNTSGRVQELASDVLEALKGPAADVAAPRAAYELLRALGEQPAAPGEQGANEG